jgi:uncharacterized membrane protein
MKFKKRWVYKMLSWKVISTAIGFFATWYAAHDFTVSLIYLAIYLPVSMVAFLAHEKLWHMWKVRNRCLNCNGMGVGTNWAGVPMECPDCEGTGDKRNGDTDERQC